MSAASDREPRRRGGHRTSPRLAWLALLVSSPALWACDAAGETAPGDPAESAQAVAPQTAPAAPSVPVAQGPIIYRTQAFPSPPLFVRINGATFCSPPDSSCAGGRLNPHIRPGENLLELEIPPTDTELPVPLDFEVGMVVPERKTLAQQRWELSELPAKRTLRFTIDKDLPACQWRRDAEALPDTQETRRAIEAFARAYHAAHTRRDAAAITEMDLYAWNERPRCLGRTLSNVRKRALERDLDDHTVDPLPSELTLERLEGGRLYQVTRAGAPLITGKFGTSGGRFRWRLFVAKIDGRLTVPF